jgi:hypothetical protein
MIDTQKAPTRDRNLLPTPNQRITRSRPRDVLFPFLQLFHRESPVN